MKPLSPTSKGSPSLYCCLICSKPPKSHSYHDKVIKKATDKILQHLFVSQRNLKTIDSTLCSLCSSCLSVVSEVIEIQNKIEAFELLIQYKAEVLGRDIVSHVKRLQSGKRTEVRAVSASKHTSFKETISQNNLKKFPNPSVKLTQLAQDNASANLKHPSTLGTKKRKFDDLEQVEASVISKPLTSEQKVTENISPSKKARFHIDRAAVKAAFDARRRRVQIVQPSKQAEHHSLTSKKLAVDQIVPDGTKELSPKKRNKKVQTKRKKRKANLKIKKNNAQPKESRILKSAENQASASASEDDDLFTEVKVTKIECQALLSMTKKNVIIKSMSYDDDDDDDEYETSIDQSRIPEGALAQVQGYGTEEIVKVQKWLDNIPNHKRIAKSLSASETFNNDNSRLQQYVQADKVGSLLCSFCGYKPTPSQRLESDDIKSLILVHITAEHFEDAKPSQQPTMQQTQDVSEKKILVIESDDQSSFQGIEEQEGDPPERESRGGYCQETLKNGKICEFFKCPKCDFKIVARDRNSKFSSAETKICAQAKLFQHYSRKHIPKRNKRPYKTNDEKNCFRCSKCGYLHFFTYSTEHVSNKISPVEELAMHYLEMHEVCDIFRIETSDPKRKVECPIPNCKFIANVTESGHKAASRKMWTHYCMEHYSSQCHELTKDSCESCYYRCTTCDKTIFIKYADDKSANEWEYIARLQLSKHYLSTHENSNLSSNNNNNNVSSNNNRSNEEKSDSDKDYIRCSERSCNFMVKIEKTEDKSMLFSLSKAHLQLSSHIGIVHKSADQINRKMQAPIVVIDGNDCLKCKKCEFVTQVIYKEKCLKLKCREAARRVLCDHYSTSHAITQSLNSSEEMGIQKHQGCDGPNSKTTLVDIPENQLTPAELSSVNVRVYESNKVASLEDKEILPSPINQSPKIETSWTFFANILNPSELSSGEYGPQAIDGNDSDSDVMIIDSKN